MGASLDPGPLTLRDLAERPVTDLKAVGDKLRSGLAEMGIETVLDLLEHYPRRYLDRTERAEIHELAIGDEATIDGQVQSMRAHRTRDGKRTIVNGKIYDGTGLLEIVFFNQAWRERQLKPGTQVSVFGKVESYRGKRQMTNPVVDVLADPEANSDITGTIVPVYPQSGKAEVHTWQLRRAVATCLQRTEARGFADPLDPALLADHELVDRGTRTATSIARSPWATRNCAAQRLKFDEFLRMQLALVARKRALAAEATGIVHAVDGELVPAFHAALPFPLTDDQAAAIARDHRRHGEASADAPAAAGRGRFGQDGRRAHRAADGGAGRVPGRVHGAHRGARRAARAHDAARCSASSASSRRDRCSASAR